jgi:hypothetical protein
MGGGGVQDARATLKVDIGPEPDADAEELAELTAGLQEELLELDVDAVELAREGEPPPGAKALDVVGLGTLLVTFAKTAGGLRSVVSTLQKWLSGQPRTVKIQLDNDVLEMTGVSSSAQDRLISDWIARHTEA